MIPAAPLKRSAMGATQNGPRRVAPSMALAAVVIRKARPTDETQRLLDAGGFYLEVAPRAAASGGA